MDELAHAQAAVSLDPRHGEALEHEIVREELEQREGVDGYFLPEIGGDASGGGSFGSDGDEQAEQLVFVDGEVVATNAAGKPVQAAPIDLGAVNAGYLGGGLDLEADGGVVRMVFNGRLRLSSLTTRVERREATALMSPLREGSTPEVDLRPYGPHHLVFDLFHQLIPVIDELDRLRGSTYREGQATMQAALREGRMDEFTQMSRELGAVHEFLRDVAEIAPELTFQDLKLLFVDLATPAFAARFPGLVAADGTVDAKQWVMGWERMAGAPEDAPIDDATVAFLLAGPNGELPKNPSRAAAVDHLRTRVVGSALDEHLKARVSNLSSLLRSDVPTGVAFGEATSYGAAVLALARSERAGAGSAFTDLVLRGLQLGEDGRGPIVHTSVGTTVELSHFDALAERAAKDASIGLVDRLGASDPARRALADPLLVGVDAALEADVFGAPLADVASALWRTPAVASAPSPTDPDAFVALARSGGALQIQRGARDEAAAAWGTPKLFGVAVDAADLECCSGDDKTRGLTNLANALERAGVAPRIVDEITALKSRANRPGGDEGLDEAVQAFLQPHLAFDPEDTTSYAAVTLSPEGRARFYEVARADALFAASPAE